MAITVNGAVLRNMPEQISKNVEDIADLQTTSENHETRIAALEAGAIALATFQDCTFTGTTTVSGTAFNVSAPATFTGGLTSNTVTAATVTATSLTAGSSTISGNETVSGTLAVNGAATMASSLAVTGAITGGSIIENMSGYTLNAQSDISWTKLYIGAVKNGNKLTIVYAGTYTKLSADPSTADLNGLVIPEDVYNKLFPVTIGLDNRVLAIQNIAFKDTSDTEAIKTAEISLLKASYKTLIPRLTKLNTLTNDVNYYFRCEFTFLLNDSL